MVIVAFVFGLVGLIGAITAICLGLCAAYKKPRLEEALPDGVYKILLVGRDKLTGAPLYKATELEGSKEGEYKG